MKQARTHQNRREIINGSRSSGKIAPIGSKAHGPGFRGVRQVTDFIPVCKLYLLPLRLAYGTLPAGYDNGCPANNSKAIKHGEDSLNRTGDQECIFQD